MNLKKYVIELDRVYRERRAEWQPLQDQLVKIHDELLDVNKSSGSKVRKAADVEELTEKRNAVNQKLVDLQNAAEKEFDSIAEQFDGEIRDFFIAKPEDVDEPAVLLLNSGVLSDHDLYTFAEKYSDNATMLKLIEQAASEKGTTAAKSLESFLKAFFETTGRHDDFEAAVYTVYRALNPEKGFADPNANYWENELFEKTQDVIAEEEKLNVDAMFNLLK